MLTLVNTYILFVYYFVNKWCDCELGCSFILSILDRSDGTKFGGSGGIWNFSNWLLVPRTYNLERIRGSVVPVEDLEL